MESYFVRRGHESYDGYIKETFDVSGYVNSKFKSDNPSVLCRLINALIKAINVEHVLPKWIVVVPDDDIIRALNHSKYGISNTLGRLVDHVMKEQEKAVTTAKEILPEKCKRVFYPIFIWIQAPMHDNFNNNSERYKFNKCIKRMASFHENVEVLQLKKVWDSTDPNLVHRE